MSKAAAHSAYGSGNVVRGQEHRIFKEMLAMRERGHHLELVCQAEATLTGRIRSQGFPVHEVAMTGPKSFAAATVHIARILKRGRFDVLNTHSRTDTKSEALGTSYLEAAACGLPLVGTRVGGVPEIIEEGVNGFLVAPGNRTQLADTLCRLVNDPALRIKLGSAARTKVLCDRRFSVDHMAQATEELYYQWMNG